MSVESLLSEVTNILGSRLAVKAADQAFFGGKQVYTGVSSAVGAGSSAAVENASGSSDPLQSAIENAQKTVKKALAGQAVGSNDGLVSEVASLKKENQDIKTELAQLKKLFEELSVKVSKGASVAAVPAAAAAPAAADKDDDFDLFGSEDEEDDDEKKKVVEERLKAYNEKKSKKPGVIAKSSIILDVKPWDDETDLGEMEKLVRGIEMDGLVWGGGKLIAIGYGIKKLQIICVIEDLKVSVDDLIEKITGDFEDHVQSVDIVAFNKI